MRKFLMAGLIAAALPAAAAQAVVYDAFTSFDGSASVNNFTFGSFNSTTLAFTPFSNDNCQSYIGGTVCNGGLPGVYKKNGTNSTFGSVIIPTDALILHPGDSVTDATGLKSAIFFTAPTDGLYTFSYSAAHTDTNPQTVSFSTLSNLGLGNVEAQPVVLLGSSGMLDVSNASLFLTAGQSFGIAVGNGGDRYFNDSTAVNFSASIADATGAVPEPASWAMMMAGFGLIGYGLRSTRRRSAFA